VPEIAFFGELYGASQVSLGRYHFIYRSVLRTYKAKLSFLEASTEITPSNMDFVPVYRQGVYKVEERDDMESDDIWKGHRCVEMPDLDTCLPPEWTILDEEFLMIYAVSLEGNFWKLLNFFCLTPRIHPLFELIF
jgi:hypothetical protein